MRRGKSTEQWLAAVGAVLFLALACTPNGFCHKGLTPCGQTACADLTSDSLDCGGCGVACAPTEVCQDSACVCRGGATSCGGTCVVTDSDPSNCGTCGKSCASGEVCEEGQCRSACILGTSVRCGGGCVNLQEDVANCGACGQACGNAQSCHAAVCTYDLVAACLSTGTVTGIQDSTYFKGPSTGVGGNPETLVALHRLLLVGDAHDQKLREVDLSTNTVLSTEASIGNDPQHLFVELPYLYVVNSSGHTLQILQASGSPDLLAPQLLLATVGEVDLGANSFPQMGPKLVEANGTEHFFLPLLGDTAGNGQRVVRVNVTDKANPVVDGSYDLTTLDLQPFPSKTTLPFPSSAILHQGAVYVALSNLGTDYAPAGPGMLAKIDPSTGQLSAVSLGSDVCLDATNLASFGDALVVGCAGMSDYSSFPTVTTTKSALLLLDSQDQRVATYAPVCPAGGGCPDPSLQKFALRGNRIFAGDTASRLFIVERVGSTLVERRGYGNAAGPLLVCPATQNADSLVAHVVSVP